MENLRLILRLCKLAVLKAVRCGYAGGCAVAVLWLCKLGGCADTSVAVLICRGNFTDVSNKLPGTS